MSTVDKLNTLHEMMVQQDLMRLDKQKLIDGIMTDEIRTKIAEIDAEFADPARTLQTNIDALEAEVKKEIITLGESVKGEHLQCCFTKPRVSWNEDGLEGLMITFPDIKKFRKIGNPSASIRKV